MNQSWKCIAFAAFAFLTLTAEGCRLSLDPFTDQDLKVAQQLDLGRIYGEVVRKRIGNYATPHQELDAQPGDTYYCLDVRTTQLNGQYSDTGYCGIRQEVYDAVEIGTKLPTMHVHNVYQIAELRGRIVDRQADPERREWYVVVDHASEVKVYRVDAMTYYRYLDIGQTLPFTPPNGRRTGESAASGQ